MENFKCRLHGFSSDCWQVQRKHVPLKSQPVTDFFSGPECSDSQQVYNFFLGYLVEGDGTFYNRVCGVLDISVQN